MIPGAGQVWVLTGCCLCSETGKLAEVNVEQAIVDGGAQPTSAADRGRRLQRSLQ